VTIALGGWLGLGPVHQIGVVTEDLDRSIARRRPSPTEWKGWVYDAGFLGWQQIAGTPASYSMRLAVSGTNPQLELVQPTGGDTSLSRALEQAQARRSGPGVAEALHHLGLFVGDFEGERSRLESLGIRCIESGGGHGLDGDGSFGYFDTVAEMGVLVELIEPPARRPAPHFGTGTA
jgi:methylmalonyl-CoA/ethylmalonyl-CoA epimerase